MTTLEQAFESWGEHERDNPYPVFAAARERGPVHRVTLADGHEAWLVVSFEEAKALLNDSRMSKDMHAALASDGDVVAEGLPGPDLARHMLVVDPPDHTRLRRLVSAAFSVRRVEQMRPEVQSVVDGLLDAVADAGPDAEVDLVSSFAFPLPFAVICELLGVAEQDRESLGSSLGTLLAPAPTDRDYARAEAASNRVVAMLGALIDQKRRNPADDLVSALIAARDGESRLDERELRSTIFQLIVAGHDTTATLIGNSVVALCRNPEQLATLKADPTMIPAAIEELLRYDAPVPHSTFRYTTEPIDVGGTTIPAGAQVIISLGAANRDETHFVDADRLIIDRDERHLSFGHGVHFCLGAPLARLEGQIALESLLHRFPDLRLAVAGDQLRWGHGDGLVLRGLTALPVIPGRDARIRA